MSSLADVTIYIEQDSGWIATPRYALLDILDSTETTTHFLSSPSNRRTITGTILSDTGDYDALVTAARNHVSVTLTTDIDSGTVYILSVGANRIQNIGAVDVHRFTAELMETS